MATVVITWADVIEEAKAIATELALISERYSLSVPLKMKHIYFYRTITVNISLMTSGSLLKGQRKC